MKVTNDELVSMGYPRVWMHCLFSFHGYCEKCGAIVHLENLDLREHGYDGDTGLKTATLWVDLICAKGHRHGKENLRLCSYYGTTHQKWEERGGPIGGCFVATAAYGSPLESELNYLRLFRDRFLKSFQMGRNFVAYYYRHSPPIADYISTKPMLRWVVRMGLYPVARILKHRYSTVTLKEGG